MHLDAAELGPTALVGVLSHDRVRGRSALSFEYDQGWLASGAAFLLDPGLALFQGSQHPTREQFGIFLDSAPDRWGRVERTPARGARRGGPTGLREVARPVDRAGLLAWRRAAQGQLHRRRRQPLAGQVPLARGPARRRRLGVHPPRNGRRDRHPGPRGKAARAVSAAPDVLRASVRPGTWHSAHVRLGDDAPRTNGRRPGELPRPGSAPSGPGSSGRRNRGRSRRAVPPPGLQRAGREPGRPPAQPRLSPRGLGVAAGARL